MSSAPSKQETEVPCNADYLVAHLSARKVPHKSEGGRVSPTDQGSHSGNVYVRRRAMKVDKGYWHLGPRFQSYQPLRAKDMDTLRCA